MDQMLRSSHRQDVRAPYVITFNEYTQDVVKPNMPVVPAKEAIQGLVNQLYSDSRTSDLSHLSDAVQRTEQLPNA